MFSHLPCLLISSKPCGRFSGHLIHANNLFWTNDCRTTVQTVIRPSYDPYLTVSAILSCMYGIILYGPYPYGYHTLYSRTRIWLRWPALMHTWLFSTPHTSFLFVIALTYKFLMPPMHTPVGFWDTSNSLFTCHTCFQNLAQMHVQSVWSAMLCR